MEETKNKVWAQPHITYEEAEAVASTLLKEYGKEEWFRGVAVEFSEELKFYVSLRVSSKTDLSLPNSQNGVSIFVQERDRTKMREKEEVL